MSIIPWPDPCPSVPCGYCGRIHNVRERCAPAWGGQVDTSTRVILPPTEKHRVSGEYVGKHRRPEIRVTFDALDLLGRK